MRVEPLKKSFGAKVYDLRIPELGTEQLDEIYSFMAQIRSFDFS